MVTRSKETKGSAWKCVNMILVASGAQTGPLGENWGSESIHFRRGVRDPLGLALGNAVWIG